MAIIEQHLTSLHCETGPIEWKPGPGTESAYICIRLRDRLIADLTGIDSFCLSLFCFRSLSICISLSLSRFRQFANVQASAEPRQVEYTRYPKGQLALDGETDRLGGPGWLSGGVSQRWCRKRRPSIKRERERERKTDYRGHFVHFGLLGRPACSGPQAASHRP